MHAFFSFTGRKKIIPVTFGFSGRVSFVIARSVMWSPRWPKIPSCQDSVLPAQHQIVTYPRSHGARGPLHSNVFCFPAQTRPVVDLWRPRGVSLKSLNNNSSLYDTCPPLTSAHVVTATAVSPRLPGASTQTKSRADMSPSPPCDRRPWRLLRRTWRLPAVHITVQTSSRCTQLIFHRMCQ